MSQSFPELRVTEFLRFCLLKIPLGAYSILACFSVSGGDYQEGRQAKEKREGSLDFS